MLSSVLDDMIGLDDPESIGWLLLITMLLFIGYSVCYSMLNIASTVMSNEHRLLQWLKRHERKADLFPVLCICLLGMVAMKLAVAFHQLLIVNEQTVNVLALQLLVVGLILTMLSLETRYRYLWEPFLLRLLQHDQAELNSESRLASPSKQQQANGRNNGLEDFKEKVAREVMTPRIDMICLEQQLSFEQNIHIAITYMRTRYPVVNEDKDDIIGFMHIKDLLAIYEEPQSRAQWQRWIRPIITVPESIEISQLLSMMQTQKTQIALLIDEYGGTSGMVTLEDIIEEIVGDIQDEFDQEEHRIIRVKSDEYELSAMLLIEEVNSYFSINLEADDMDSIGGFMYANIQFPPHIGQSVIYEQEEQRYIFTISGMEQLRITSVGVKRCNKELRMSRPQL